MTDKVHCVQQIVEIVLRGSAYKVACREGERERLVELSKRLSDRIDAAVPGSVRSKATDALLLLLVGLQLEDRIEELELELARVRENLEECRAQRSQELAMRNSLKELLRYSITKTNELADCVMSSGSE